MRIHSDVLTTTDIHNALRGQKNLHRVAHTVNFATLSSHGSRSREAAFEIKLESYQKVDGDGRRWGNSGQYGATSQTTGEYTATYDEWGWLLSALYDLDSAMVTPYYADKWDFHERTALSYDPLELIKQIERYDSDPYPYVWRKPQAGRIGFGRVTGDEIPRSVLAHYKNLPRSIVQVQEFGKLNPTLTTEGQS